MIKITTGDGDFDLAADMEIKGNILTVRPHNEIFFRELVFDFTFAQCGLFTEAYLKKLEDVKDKVKLLDS